VKVRSLVGLIPLYAVERLELEWVSQFKEFKGSLDWFVENRKELAGHVVNRIDSKEGEHSLALTIVDRDQLVRMLDWICDKDEFMSDFGLRSLSAYHLEHPFSLGGNSVSYEPGERIARSRAAIPIGAAPSGSRPHS
jgi:hypothetical protein